MLARIKCHQHLTKSVKYNEQKIETHKAVCLDAVNFIKTSSSLTMAEKIARFDQRTSLHSASKCNAVHISLNFSTKDNLSDEKLKKMTEYYMKEIGFQHQPYLVYRHFDSYHPHVHVVTTNITSEGKRIQLNGIVRMISRQVTTQMENTFSLTKNNQHIDKAVYQVKNALQVSKGEAGIKASISDVLNAVLPHYNYINFEEANAVLRLYNVAAHCGEEGSRLYKLGGLLYYALNNKGERISVPLRSSSFSLKPTLKYLENRYQQNLVARKEMDLNIEAYVKWIMAGTRPTWEKFSEALEKEGVSLVTLADKHNGKENIFFIHHAQKFVIAGEILGPEYSLQSLKEKCSMEERQEQGFRHQHTLRI